MKNSTSRINRVLANENSQKQILHRIQLSLAVYQLDAGFAVKSGIAYNSLLESLSIESRKNTTDGRHRLCKRGNDGLGVQHGYWSDGQGRHWSACAFSGAVFDCRSDFCSSASEEVTITSE